MSGMLLVSGLAVDTGQLMVARRSLQDAADMGALGGAVSLYQGGSVAQATANATADVSSMGYTNGVGGASVAVNVPPVSGPNSGNASYVEVIVSVRPRTYFMPSSTVTARGVAGTTPGASGPAILALSRTADPAIDTQGNGSISVSGGDIYSDSSGARSLSTGGNGTITATSPATIQTVGGYAAGGNLSPTPLTGKPVLPDPFSGFTKPACPAGTSSCTTGFQSCCTSTISPGVYRSITLSSNSNVAMDPGVYIIEGGGITLSGNGDLTGTGVFIFITTSTYPNSGTSCQGLQITGNGDLVVTAPTSGTYKGMVIYQDASCSATMDLSGNGNGTATTGTIYAPSAEVSLHGNGDLTLSSELIANTVDLGGNGNLTVNYSSSQNAQESVPALAE